LNLFQDSEELYDACPYCLTEIVMDNEPTIASAESENFESEETEEPEEAEIKVEEKEYLEEPAKIPEIPSECSHYIGYLSEKSAKEQIPDECMMCKDLVTCMLQKMKP
jgi:hypothetical protein